MFGLSKTETGAKTAPRVPKLDNFDGRVSKLSSRVTLATSGAGVSCHIQLRPRYRAQIRLWDEQRHDRDGKYWEQKILGDEQRVEEREGKYREQIILGDEQRTELQDWKYREQMILGDEQRAEERDGKYRGADRIGGRTES